MRFSALGFAKFPRLAPKLITYAGHVHGCAACFTTCGQKNGSFCRLLFFGDVIIMGMFGSAIVVVLNHEYAMNLSCWNTSQIGYIHKKRTGHSGF